MSSLTNRTVFVLVYSCLGLAWGRAEPAPKPATKVDFQRQVRPILSDNCFLCHGPDKGTRMAGLRLDIQEGAMAPRKNGSTIVPGKPDESLLIKRIFSDNPAFRMPPVIAHKILTEEQKEILRRWIEQGAEWKQHWAFVPPVKATVPEVEVKDAKWARNEIDRFILAKLETTGLAPSPEADKRTLIRRVTLDLTGLPPTPAEVDAFLKDRSTQAYEKVVDRLLASPRYGEHRARYWLDAARYADTQGLHIDNYREMWPYRDWVIQAFNANMPFDRFTIEQLGGDLLPKPTLGQEVASGFHRCNVTTNEGGSIPAEVAAMYAKDRADTSGTVWMGLTVGCATCHDHKFDPISQRDYYALTAFFRNTTQSPLDGNVPDTPPTVIVPRSEDRAKWAELTEQRAKVRAALDANREGSRVAFDKWLASPARSEAASYNASSHLLDLRIAANVVAVRAGNVQPVSMSEGVSVVESAPVSGQALHFEKDGSATLPNVAEIDTDKPFTISTWVYVPKTKDPVVIGSQFDSQPSGKPGDLPEKRRGWTVEIDTGVLGVSGLAPAIRLVGEDGKYLSARPGPDFELKPENWYHFVFTYDGSRQREGLSLYVNGSMVPTYGTGEDISPLQSSIRATAPLMLGSGNHQHFAGGSIGEFRVLSGRADPEDAEMLFLSSKIEAAAKKTSDDLSQQEREAVAAYYEYAIDPTARNMVTSLKEIEAERYKIARTAATTFVMQERADAQPIAHVLYRGQYDAMREEVHPNVPAVLPPMSQSLPRNRLGLAKWLVDPSNPLTARVTVNRFWQEVFGTGLVKTAEDFGSQGEPPSHPELLDWLAVDFRDSGWDVKRIFRMIVTAAAYRQDATTTPDKVQRDPDNRLLSHGPRFRMDGEMVRDYALAASGLLRGPIGGPSVKPYQPMNVWETVAMDNSNTRFYQRDTGDKLYRRSLYTFWKRSAPPASMDIFNAPSRETCVVRRERTNTPLQALVTMNDPQFIEAARALAQNALLSSKRHLDREMNYMAYRLLARNLDPKELNIVTQSYRDYLSYYDSKPDDAARLLHVGESEPDAHLTKPEFAAMTMVANEMLNLDEVLVK